jgi:regulator of protease activity HflC (stomatin/prohibitin superfamily)
MATQPSVQPLPPNGEGASKAFEIPRTSPLFFWLIAVIWLSLISIAGVVLLGPTSTFQLGPLRAHWLAIFFLGILPTYVGLNVREQTINEWGVKLLFNSLPLQVTKVGPLLTLWPIVTLRKFPKDTVQEQYPDETKNIWWETVTPESPLPAGKVEPHRATTKMGTKKQTEKDTLNHRLTIDFSASVTYRIKDPIRYWMVIGDQANARKQIEDVAIAVLLDLFGQKTPAWIISHMNLFNLEFERAVSFLVNGTKPQIKNGKVVGGEEDPQSAWGVQVIVAIIVHSDLPKEVNQAMRDVPAAEFIRRTTITKSEGEKQRLINVGAGNAQANEDLFASIGIGAQIASDASGLDPEVVVAAGTGQKVAEKVQSLTAVGSGGIADLAATVTAVSESVRRQSSRPPTPPPPEPPANP